MPAATFHVMISSTSLDLPTYREQVRLACERLGMVPVMMEHLSARPGDAQAESLNMVDQADVYVGLFAHRYGYIPPGSEKSMTHLEYERARERGIPCLVYMLDEDQPVRKRDIDTGEKASKLEALKAHLLEELVVTTFRTPLELSGLVFQSLVEFRDAFLQTILDKNEDTVETPPDELPPLPPMDLPASPYRRLQRFRREDARVFFGRSEETRELFKAVTESWCDPIILLYGESGVGKSSLLAAGLLPRLEATHQVHYLRREAHTGLDVLLADAFGIEVSASAEAWRSREAREKRPMLIILDQVEEMYTRPLDGEDASDERQMLGQQLVALFQDPLKRPAGRLVLAFRKEWVADIESWLDALRLPYHKLHLERLGVQGVLEVVKGPAEDELMRRKYRLAIESGLPDLIAVHLLKDRQSPVGPPLSILLSKMWDLVKDDPEPAFTEALFFKMEAEGLMLEDFLEEKLQAFRAWRPELIESGLLLDLLNYFTTARGTAESRPESAILARYPHRVSTIREMLNWCIEHYLLLEVDDDEIRLTHDTLAPLLRQAYRTSTYPGQRAERVLLSRIAGWRGDRRGLPLDSPGLAEVEAGAAGMRGRDADEERLVSVSRRGRMLRRVQRVGGVLVVAALLGISYLLYTGRQTAICDASEYNAWCYECLDAGGAFNTETENDALYCTGADFGAPFTDDDFVALSPGTFAMGSDGPMSFRTERPVHEVTISTPFAIGKTEVTQAQWYAVMGTNPSEFKKRDRPVENVSWDDVQEFFARLNETEGCTDCYRLPTEAEWEYAVRAGSNTAYSFGDDEAELNRYAWYDTTQTRVVAEMLSNPGGLYDVHGNVLEWVEDWYGAYNEEPVVDPRGPENGTARVVRGGGWWDPAVSLRSAYRARFDPGVSNSTLGFRVVRDSTR